MKKASAALPGKAGASRAASPAHMTAPATPERTGMLELQRTIGNRAARALLATPAPPAAANADDGDVPAVETGESADPPGAGDFAPPAAITRADRPPPFEISAGAPTAADDAADPALARVRAMMLADEVRAAGTTAAATVTGALHAGQAGLGRRAERAASRIGTEIGRGLETVTTMFGAERSTWAAAFARGEAAVAASKVLHQGLAWVRSAATLVTISGLVKDARDRVETSITDAIDRVGKIRDAQQRHVHDRTDAIAKSARELGDHKAESYQDTDLDLRADKRAAVREMAQQFADGVTTKEDEAKKSVADGLAELPGGFRTEGDKVKAKLEDPTPQIAPKLGDATRATTDRLAEQAAAGRDALRDYARSALAALASGEQAVRTALEQMRTAAIEQVRVAAGRGRQALGQTARRMTTEIAGASDDAAQALVAEQHPDIARSRQFVRWVAQQQQAGAERFAEAMPATVARLARPMSGIAGATGARVAGVGKRIADWLTAQRAQTTGQLDAGRAHIDDSLAAILAAFVDVLADTERQIRVKLALATDDVEKRFQDATQKTEHDIAGKIDEAYDQAQAGLPELGTKMDDTVEQIDWDDRHPVLSTLRDIGLFIAGELVGLLKLALKLVVGLVLVVAFIVGLVLAGMSFALAAAIAAVLAIGYLVYQIGAATYRRYREGQAAGNDRGFWASLGLGFADVSGLTKIYGAFTAKGLTPFQRGEAYIDGVGDLAGVVLTVAGVRGQIKEIKLSAAEPIPYGNGAALEGTQGLSKFGRALRIPRAKGENGGIPRIERARAIKDGLVEAGADLLARMRGSKGQNASRPAVGTEPAAGTTPAATTEPAVTPEPAATTKPTAATKPAATTEPAVTPDSAVAPEPSARPGTREPAPAAREAVESPSLAPPALPEPPANLSPPVVPEPSVSVPPAPAVEPAPGATGGAAAPPPGKAIFEPFVGDSLASPTDLMARNPGSTVIAAEATLMPSAEQVATFQGRGGRFLTDRFGESLPANSVDELHVRYPLPHQKSTEMALHLTPAELADPLAAVQARMASIESLQNLAPEALRTLQPEGTLEVIFAEKEIVTEVDAAKKLRWTDPETGAVYRFEVVSPPRVIPRAEANAPYSGMGIPKTTTEVYIAKLRKAAVPEAPARSVPEGALGPGRSKLAPGTRSRQTEGWSEKHARPAETHGQILRDGKQLLEETVPGIEPELRELVHPEARAEDRLALESLDRQLEALANDPALTGQQRYKDLTPAARAERAALEQRATRLAEERATLVQQIEDSLHQQVEGNKTKAIGLMARLRKALLGPESTASPRTTITPKARNAIRASGRGETDVLGDLAEHQRLTGKAPPRTLDYSEPRAHYDHERKSIHVGDDPSKQTILHEASHPIEHQHAEISEASKSFRDARGRFAAGGEDAPLRSMRELAGNPKFRENEVGVEAGFADKYTGKVYPPGEAATEVVTMGLQAFEDAPAMFTLYRQDPELFLFILGVLRTTRGAPGR